MGLQPLADTACREGEESDAFLLFNPGIDEAREWMTKFLIETVRAFDARPSRAGHIEMPPT